MASASSQSIRRWIVTAAVTAVTITGALYGAGLKTQQEFKLERAAVLEASMEDRIAQLESVKYRYVQQKNELQAKIDRLTTKLDLEPGSRSAK